MYLGGGEFHSQVHNICIHKNWLIISSDRHYIHYQLLLWPFQLGTQIFVWLCP